MEQGDVGMLEFKDVSFRYAKDVKSTVENLSFSMEEKSFVSIIGSSGCGKSTIFRLINGLEKKEKGEILVDGKRIEEIKNYSAYMPQKDLLYPWRTVEKNLFLPMEINNTSKEEMKEKTEKILKEVGLFEYAKRYPKELSGGMKQRAAFARTLLTGCDLLLLDEPFSALDSLTKIEMQQWLLAEWKKYEKTILFVTHDVEEAIFLSKKILVVTQTPITKFEEYIVPMEYPRKRDDMKTKEIIELKEYLISNLRQKVIV